MAIERFSLPSTGNRPTPSQGFLSCFYAIAGVFHLALPGPFLRITPDWVPHPHAMIALTGICELAGSVALLTPRFRRSAGWCLALYAVCVFPANIKHAAMDLSSAGGGLGYCYHLPRLALQPVIVWWALYAGGVTRWPFRPDR